jgi:hypothetical protein
MKGRFNDLGEIAEMKSRDGEDRYIIVRRVCFAIRNQNIDRDFLPTVFGWRIVQIVAL